MVITSKTFQEAIRKYIAVNLFNKGLKIEAYLIILTTWNFANFRYAVKDFDLISFEKTLKALEKNFAPLDNIEFRRADFDSYIKDICEIYISLSKIKGIYFTGASKLMHLRNRKLFILWDDYIRGLKSKRYYEKLDIVKQGNWIIKRYGNKPEDYIEFLKDMQKRFSQVHFKENRKTFAKAIDEFNYVTITLPIQEMEKEEKKVKGA